MTYAPGGIPGAPRDAEIMRQYGKAKQQQLQAEAVAGRLAHEARRGWLRRLLRRGSN
jgi:hypothetical protein